MRKRCSIRNHTLQNAAAEFIHTIDVGTYHMEQVQDFFFLNKTMHLASNSCTVELTA